MVRTLRNPRTLFTLAALTFVAICATVVRTSAYARNPDMLAWGFTFDLTLSIPLFYWLVVIRGGHAKPLTIAPLFIVCVAVAGRVIPHDQQSLVQQLRFVSAPLELLTIAMIARRVIGMRKARASSADVADRIAAASAEVFGAGRLASIVASEVTILYYAFAGWGKSDRPGFTFHCRCGWGTLVAGLMMALVAESIAVHMFLLRWGWTAAWIATALDVWGMLWFLGDYHAMRLRPTVVDGDNLVLRYGLRRSAVIPLANIAAVEPAPQTLPKNALKIAMFDDPRLLVTFHEPVLVHGIAGINRSVTALALLPDDVDEFADALRPAASRPASS